jgi:rhodanese-related sulfurtransferase
MMSKKLSYSLSLILISLFLLVSCSDDPCNCPTFDDTTFDSTTEMVNDAKSRITEITVDSLRSKFSNQESFYLIDVREFDEYEAGHIDDYIEAICIPRGLVDLKLTVFLPEITYDSDIVLYCKSGNRSALAADDLMKLKYTRVVSLQGGWEEWIK